MLARILMLCALGCYCTPPAMGQRLNQLIVSYENGTIRTVDAGNPEANPDSVLAKWKSIKGVQAVQWDYRLVFHGTPNDPEYRQQWSLPRIGMEAAWNLSKGGRTAAGDTLVVAIIDAGFDIGHKDLAANVWINRGEVPDDGIDNDGNGFTDDIHGWNFSDETGEFPPDYHGTAVAGIIGAAGNNGIGVSGINQHILLMLFRTEKVSEVIKAHQYMIRQRELYQSTNGKSGAMVVVANASFGIPGVFCREQAVWAGMIEQTGRTGILTVAATANQDMDIDVAGDMPATCNSPFLISVMNTDPNDAKEAGSAYGRQSIDIGAPGVQVYTTMPGNTYGFFSGTSAAAPQVSGAVALLYSVPCAVFAQTLRLYPEQAALIIKQAILEGAEKKPYLDKLCVSEGRLSVSGSMAMMTEQCALRSATEAIGIAQLYPNPAQGEGLVVAYAAPDDAPVYWQITNTMGQVIRKEPLPQPNTWQEKRLYIRLAGLPAGAYTLSLLSDGAAVHRWFIRM
jgi:hypothetical protein